VLLVGVLLAVRAAGEGDVKAAMLCAYAGRVVDGKPSSAAVNATDLT
jgi:hypothetical protein